METVGQGGNETEGWEYQRVEMAEKQVRRQIEKVGGSLCAQGEAQWVCVCSAEVNPFTCGLTANKEQSRSRVEEKNVAGKMREGVRGYFLFSFQRHNVYL